MEEKEEVKKGVVPGCRQRERERMRKRKIRSLFPFSGRDMINRFLLI